MPVTAEAGSGRSQEPGTPAGSATWVARAQVLGSSSASQTCWLEAGSEMEIGLDPRFSGRDYVHPKQWLGSLHRNITYYSVLFLTVASQLL